MKEHIRSVISDFVQRGRSRTESSRWKIDAERGFFVKILDTYNRNKLELVRPQLEICEQNGLVPKLLSGPNPVEVGFKYEWQLVPGVSLQSLEGDARYAPQLPRDLAHLFLRCWSDARLIHSDSGLQNIILVDTSVSQVEGFEWVEQLHSVVFVDLEDMQLDPANTEMRKLIHEYCMIIFELWVGMNPDMLLAYLDEEGIAEVEVAAYLTERFQLSFSTSELLDISFGKALAEMFALSEKVSPALLAVVIQGLDPRHKLDPSVLGLIIADNLEKYVDQEGNFTLPSP